MFLEFKSFLLVDLFGMITDDNQQLSCENKRNTCGMYESMKGQSAFQNPVIKAKICVLITYHLINLSPARLN